MVKKLSVWLEGHRSQELSNQILSSGISKDTHISMFISDDTGGGHVSDLVKCDISYDLHYL